MYRWLFLVLWIFSGSTFGAVAEQVRETVIREDLLTASGEMLSVSVKGLSRKEAGALADSVLQVINELDASLQKNTPSGKMLSGPQKALIDACESWREKTGNHVSCRLGALSGIWQEVAQQQRELPERSDVRKQARQLARIKSEVVFDQQDNNLIWYYEVIRRGFMLDNALALVKENWPQIKAAQLMLNDRAVYFSTDNVPQALALAEDLNHFTESSEAGSVVVNNLSIAMNTREKLEWKSGHRRFSQLINPVDGWPKEFSPSVVVVAPDAVTAEALANALTVMNIAKGIALINRLPDIEALIMTSMGKTFASDGWYSLLIPDESHQSLWDSDMEFLVEYQTLSHKVAEYRRPYIAVWITDPDKNAVRQLLVHGESLRWLREIPLWWRRYGRRDETMIDGLARATPLPGQHMLVWDGRDDRGHKVEEGDYLLHIEAAREHGGRELVTLPFHLSGSGFSSTAEGKTELGSVSIHFRKRS